MEFQVISRNYLLHVKIIVAFLKIPIAWFVLRWVTVFPNNLSLYSKDFKLLTVAISALKLVASFFDEIYNLPVVSEKHWTIFY